MRVGTGRLLYECCCLVQRHTGAVVLLYTISPDGVIPAGQDGTRGGAGEAPDAAGPIRLPEFGIDLSLDEVYSGIDFD